MNKDFYPSLWAPYLVVRVVFADGYTLSECFVCLWVCSCARLFARVFVGMRVCLCARLFAWVLFVCLFVPPPVRSYTCAPVCCAFALAPLVRMFGRLPFVCFSHNSAIFSCVGYLVGCMCWEAENAVFFHWVVRLLTLVYSAISSTLLECSSSCMICSFGLMNCYFSRMNSRIWFLTIL